MATRKSLFGSVKEKFRGTSAAPSKAPLYDGPPPAYSAVAPTPVATHSAIGSRDDDEYAFLSNFDTIFLIDDSYSMSGSRWSEVDSLLRTIVPICTARDEDGVDLYFINHQSTERHDMGQGSGGYYSVRDAATVQSIFHSVVPNRKTPTGARLRTILKPYVAKLKSAKDMDNVKPINIIVITDGRATDDPESQIIEFARALDKMGAPLGQVGLQFFQIGNDRVATEFLRELDDGLAHHGIRDMVDTTTWDGSNQGFLTADGVLKAVLGGVTRRLDRKPVGAAQRRR